jgi:hypothetical protein
MSTLIADLKVDRLIEIAEAATAYVRARRKGRRGIGVAVQRYRDLAALIEVEAEPQEAPPARLPYRDDE